MPVLISVEELAEAIAGGSAPVLLDVRWALTGPPGYESYRQGHLSGAVFVHLDTELAGHGPATAGRHPLPSVAALQAAARRWGINVGDRVVAYDGAGNLAAARAWWLLRSAGLTDVRLLDGALPAWIEAGHPLETDHVVPKPGTISLMTGQLAVLELGEVEAFAASGVLLDARVAERYRGDVEPVDPKAGHIPGAVNAPTGDNLQPTGRFKTADELRQRFAALGVDGTRPVAAYCGSGVTAAHEIAALAIAGIDAALYAGSWSQWSNLDLPVETARDNVPAPLS